MRVAADGIGDKGKVVQDAVIDPAACHAGLRRRVPECQHKADSKRPEQLHHVQWFVLENHSIAHARKINEGEDDRQGHRHLHDPPKRPLVADEGICCKELVCTKNHVINFLFEQVDAKINNSAVAFHNLFVSKLILN